MSDYETAPEMLERLGTDAMLWAQEFSKTAVKLGYSAMDEGWLISWFANAIENCDVVRCNPIRAELAAVTAERDRMREALKRIDGMATTICMRADAGYGMTVETVMPIYETARAAIEGVKEPESPKGETHGQ